MSLTPHSTYNTTCARYSFWLVLLFFASGQHPPDVVVPPDILDFSTSTDMVVQEGVNVTLKCAARGSPTPVITWRREGNDLITLPDGEEGE